MYKGDLSQLRLEKLQVGPVTFEQKKEVYEYIKAHLEEAVETIESSQIYRLAKREGRLYYNMEATKPFFEKSRDQKNKGTSLKRHLSTEIVIEESSIKRIKTDTVNNSQLV